MAQYRKTFFSMGGPERIADPGADEAARLLAIRAQQEGVASQNALAQQRMSLEERLALEEGRRQDARLASDVAARQQQGALAERGFGLDERRLGETVRSNQAGERSAMSRDSLAAELGRAGLGVQRDELALRREQEATQGQRFELTRQDTRRQSSDEMALRRELAQQELGARAHQAVLEENDRARAAEEQRAFEREQHGTSREEQLSDFERNVGMEREDRARAEGRDASKAAAEAVGGEHGLDLGPIPDDPNVEADASGKPMFYDTRSDVAPLVQRIEAAFGAPTTASEVEATKNALADQIRLRFEREMRQQQLGWGFDNSSEQAVLRDLLLGELERTAAAHMARVKGSPGPEAPKPPTPRPNPRPPR